MKNHDSLFHLPIFGVLVGSIRLFYISRHTTSSKDRATRIRPGRNQKTRI